MKTNNDTVPKGAGARVPSTRYGRRSAVDRLTSEGLISKEAYYRLFAEEAADWAAIRAMNEAALDAELGPVEVAAIDALAGRPVEGLRGPPSLQVVPQSEAGEGPAPYRHHYRVRVAGVDGGLMGSSSDIEVEVREIRRLLMASEGCFLPEAVHDLNRYVHEGRVLVVESLEHGTARIEGCVAFGEVEVCCSGGPEGDVVRQRINMIRLLAVRGCARRSHLAIRLCLEAQLRGTVRAMYEGDGPQCIGTVGVILGANRRAIDWATRLKHRVRLVGSRAKSAASAPALAALRYALEDPRDSAVRGIPYSFVVANRMQLIEAAHRHLIGVTPYPTRRDEPGLRIDYDQEDPCVIQVHKIATGIAARDPAILNLLGLTGECDATIWGPPPTDAMSAPIGPDRRESTKAEARA